MKLIHAFTLACLLTRFSLSEGLANDAQEQGASIPRDTTFAVSPHYSSDKMEIGLALSLWTLRQPGMRPRFIDAWTGEEITQFEVPKVSYFQEVAVARKIGKPFQAWIDWLSKKTSDSKLEGSGAVDIPKLLARLAQERAIPECLIIVGSPLARFPNQIDYDFCNPVMRFPADGQIAFDKRSPFSSEDMERSLYGTRIFFLYPKIDTGSWPADFERKLHHFYGVFFQSRSGNLASFTPNLRAGLKLFTEGGKIPLNIFPTNSVQTAMIQADGTSIVNAAPSAHPSTTEQTLIPAASASAEPIVTNSFPPMSRSLEKPAPLDLSNGLNPTLATNEPATSVARTNIPASTQPLAALPLVNSNITLVPLPSSGVTIQLRYAGDLNTDLDIYVRPHPDAEEVSFRHNVTALASYEYLYDFTTKEHVKSIHLPSGCDTEKATVWINYRRGFGLAAGRVLWLTPANSLETPVALHSQRGGDGDSRRDYFRKRSDCWLRVNLLAVATSGTKSSEPATSDSGLTTQK